MPIGPKGQKRPRDANQLAKLIVDIATGQVEDREPEHGRGASCYQKIRRHSARDRATARSATHPQVAMTFQACQSV